MTQKKAPHSGDPLPFQGKPFLRGHFHQAAFFVSLGAGALLIAGASSPLARAVAVVYCLCLCILFGISSLYHRINWNENLRRLMRKFDHAGIFIFIAGTGTPVALLGLSETTGKKLFLIFWGAAFAGIAKEFLWSSAPRWVSALLYVLMGWFAFPLLEELKLGLGMVNVALLIAGGLVYTLGALVYAFKWPNPYPRHFGFHEIFHALVVVAGILHFLVVYQLITQAPVFPGAQG